MWCIGGSRDGQWIDSAEWLDTLSVPIWEPRPVSQSFPPAPLAKLPYGVERYFRRCFYLASSVEDLVEAWVHEAEEPKELVCDMFGFRAGAIERFHASRALGGSGGPRAARRLAGRLHQYFYRTFLPEIRELMVRWARGLAGQEA